MNNKNNSNSTWKFVYEHNKNGEAIKGNLKQLTENILNGCEVRVILNYSESYQYQNGWNAQIVAVRNNHVFVQNNTELSVANIYDNKDGKFFKENAYHYYCIASSKGLVDVIRYNCSDGKERGHSQHKARIKWFTR